MNATFAEYKDKHKRKRVFLIGNGPSLAETDLDLIKDECSFAMNRVSLIYDKNPGWRPTYYLFSSTNVMPSKPWHREWRKSVREAVSEERTTSFVADKFRGDIDPRGEFKDIKWFSSMSEIKPDLQGSIHPACFSTNVVERIDKTGTTMNLALQLCYHMGFSEIILVGADLGWTHDTGTKSDPNHFVKDYVAEIIRPEKTNYQMRNIHSLALAYFQKDKPETKFYNASAKSVLDIYPMIDFESFVNAGQIVRRPEDEESAKSFWSRPAQYSSLI